MKSQERCCQGLIASSVSQRRTVDTDRAGAIRRATASRASSGHDQREIGTPVGGQSAGQRLDLGGLQRREPSGTAAALTAFEPEQARLGEPATPAAHGVQVQPRLPGDARVGTSARGVQDDLRTHPQPVLGLVAVGHLLQPHAFGGSQGYRTGSADGHGGRTDRLKWITGKPQPAPPTAGAAPRRRGWAPHPVP